MVNTQTETLIQPVTKQTLFRQATPGHWGSKVPFFFFKEMLGLGLSTGSKTGVVIHCCDQQAIDRLLLLEWRGRTAEKTPLEGGILDHEAEPWWMMGRWSDREGRASQPQGRRLQPAGLWKSEVSFHSFLRLGQRGGIKEDGSRRDCGIYLFIVGDHSAMHSNTKSLSCTPESKVVLYQLYFN